MHITRYSDYDSFSFIYDKYWSKISLDFIPVLDKLILQYKEKGANILDLCCGTGRISAALASKGYNVTGIDSSEQMIALAKENAPNVNFIVEDARTFNFPPTFDIAISMFDSLNHIQNIKHLELAFNNVFRSLNIDGMFVFDLNMEDAYKNTWMNHQSNVVEDNVVCATRCSYDTKTKIGKFETTIFQLDNGWKRKDIFLYQKCYSKKDILVKLNSAGFQKIKVYDALNDLKLNTIGRYFFVAQKT